MAPRLTHSDTALERQAPVVVRGLCKSYGRFTAVRDLDLTVAGGEVFALLGPNGAGKTTTVEILQGFRRRDSGRVLILGEDPEHDSARWRSRIGVVPQSTGSYDDLTVTDVVRQFAAFQPDPLPVGQVIEMVGLSGKAGARASALSGGQQRRLDVAVGVVGDPELIFLDEPTTGLDPAARRAAWDLVRFFADRGATTLLTTHYLDEAQALADRAAVVVGGRIVECGPVDDLGDRAGAPSVISFQLPTALPDGALDDLRRLATVDPGGPASISTLTPTADLATLLAWAAGYGLGELPDLRVHRPTLEETYLQLVAAHSAPQGQTSTTGSPTTTSGE